jgi:hypothetical protein
VTLDYTRTEIVGIDPSLSRTGIAMVDGCDSISTDLRGMARLAYIRDEVLAACGRRTRLAVIEGYSMNGQRGSGGVGQMLGELGGVIRLTLWEQGVRVVDVPPASLKKFALGDLKPSDRPRDKKAMKAAAELVMPWPIANHDEADAAWLRALGAYAAGIHEVPAAPFRDAVVAALGLAQREAA